MQFHEQVFCCLISWVVAFVLAMMAYGYRRDMAYGWIFLLPMLVIGVMLTAEQPTILMVFVSGYMLATLAGCWDMACLEKKLSAQSCKTALSS